jgi:hypothetical protein
MDPKIADFIRANRGQYTREAIRQRLIEAGHPAEEVDWTWEHVVQTEALAAPSPSGFRWYAWGLYGLVCVLILLTLVIGSPDYSLFGVAWLVAFAAVAFLPARWFARQHPIGALNWVGLLIAVPIVFLLVGVGICVATIVVVLSTGSLS